MSHITSDAEHRAEYLTGLALDLNLNLGAADYAVVGKIGALPESDMLHVLAASNTMAALFLKLAIKLSAE